MRYNKDSEGGFTDEAIEAVEQELTRLADKIDVDEMELSERIADERQSCDYIEMEIIGMRIVAVDLVHERAVRRIAQVETNLPAKKLLIGTAYACAGIGIIFGIASLLLRAPMIYVVPALVFSLLFIMTLFAAINAQAIDQWLMREIDVDLNLAKEIQKSAKAMLRSTVQ